MGIQVVDDVDPGSFDVDPAVVRRLSDELRTSSFQYGQLALTGLSTPVFNVPNTLGGVPGSDELRGAARLWTESMRASLKGFKREADDVSRALERAGGEYLSQDEDHAVGYRRLTGAAALPVEAS